MTAHKSKVKLKDEGLVVVSPGRGTSSAGTGPSVKNSPGYSTGRAGRGYPFGVLLSPYGGCREDRRGRAVLGTTPLDEPELTETADLIAVKSSAVVTLDGESSPARPGWRNGCQ